MTDINRYTDELRHEIDAALDAATVFGDGCPKRLSDAIRYSLLAPGKRLRPLLTLLACELFGGDRLRAMPAACAVEMIHAYSLIHDDLPSMDDDDLRRGRPTCHKQFDEPTAILAGDSLQPLAFEMIGRLEPLETAGRCCGELAVAAGACRLVGGQMDDVAIEKGLYSSNGDWRTAPEASRELMEKIHLRKTGALMRIALRMGGIVAGATGPELELLDDFGVYFGLAFQVTDDLLDVLGDEETVGKRLRKDADKNKWSYPTLLGVEESQKEAETFVRKAIESLDRLDRPDSIAHQTLRSMVESLLERKM